MNSTALLLEVKRFAVHDGPGVRTVFFLKGCPLKCRWCHNPESISSKPQLAYYEHKCIQCGECVPVCLVQAHKLLDGKHFFDRTECLACGACEDVCLGQSLKLLGKTINVEEARELAIEDKDFFEPDGGITISGGEPLLQSEFCAELFKLLKKENIHCAIDTCGAVSWKKFETVLLYTDLLLYDIKHVDEKRHIEYTGCSNKLILENLKKLSKCNIPIEIRIPIIPEFNMDTDSINAIGEKLSKLSNITAVQLLAYHDFASSKYGAIGKINTMPKVIVPSVEQIEKIANKLKKYNLPIKY